MSDQKFDQSQIRRYLLGTLSAEIEIEQIELEILANESFLDYLEMAEDDLIDDYLDLNLTDKEREKFESDFLASPRLRENLQFMISLRQIIRKRNQDTVKTPSSHQNRRKFKLPGFNFPQLAIAACLLIITGISIYVWVKYYRLENDGRALALLQTAYRVNRPLDSRVSSLNYAAYEPTRGANEIAANRTQLSEAELLLLKQVNASPSVSSYHALGRFYLLNKQFAEAISQFEAAKNLNNSPDPALLSDLAAAHLELGKTLSADGKNVLEYSTALGYCEQALKIDSQNRGAGFNKALTLEALKLPQQARFAWEKYLKIDADSQWAQEARLRLAALPANSTSSIKASSEIIKSYLSAYRARNAQRAYQIVSRNREMITSKLVCQQLVFLFLESDDAEAISALEYLAKIERDSSGDKFVSDLAQFYRALKDPAAREKLRNAAELFKTGYRFCLTGKENLALLNFEKAKAIYHELKNTAEAGLSDYWIGYCQARTGSVPVSLKTFDLLRTAAQAHGYIWLSSQANGWQSINLLSAGEFSKAFSRNDDAHSAAVRVNDLYNTQKTFSQRAVIYRELKNYPQAIEYLGKALSFVTNIPEASVRQKWRDYDQLSEVLFGMKHYAAAESYETEALNLGKELGDPTFIAAASLNLGVIAGAQERLPEAFAYFAAAREQIPLLSGSPLKSAIENRLNLYAGQIMTRSNQCQNALPLFQQAAVFFAAADSKGELYEAQKGQLLCYKALNESAKFGEQLAEVLDYFRVNRTQILEEQNRNLYFDAEQNIYDIATEEAVERADYERGFGYAEESKTRSLLDLQQGLGKVKIGEGLPEVIFEKRSSESIKLADFQKSLSSDVQVVQYTVLPDRLLIWIINPNRVSVTPFAIENQELKTLITHFREEIQTAPKNTEPISGDVSDQFARRLYEVLIKPIEAELDPAKEISFIPEKELSEVAFSALKNPESGEYLIKRYRQGIAPSASVLVSATNRARELNSQETAATNQERILAVGDPSFDRQSIPEFPKLDAADREAEEIGSMYRQATVLTAELATADAISRQLPSSDVFHYAGHYLIDIRSPLLSGLLTSGASRGADGGYSNLIYNYEIISRRLPHTKLAVVAGCRSGIENYFQGEGAVGGARAYLAAGVPVVIASNWDIDSEASRRLMVNFHRNRQKLKLSTTDALRQAQLEMLEGNDSKYRLPYYWAAFSRIGGFTKY